MSETHAGRCFCGAIRFRVSDPITQACYCHCESCRRASGAPYVAWCTVSRAQFSLSRGELATYASSPRVTRGFCARCGTSLTYAHEARPDEIDLTIVTFEAPERIVPTRHIWVEDKLPWVTIDDGLPQFQRWSAQG